MNTRTVLPPALLVLAAALAGCNFQLGSSTPGQQGNATFAYTNGDGCFFGCDTARAMMIGTTEPIIIQGNALPAGLTASSDDPSVLTVTLADSPSCCTTGTNSGGCFSLEPGATCSGTLTQNYVATVTAVSAGDAKLILDGAGSSLFDALPLRVAAPASLAFSCAGSSASNPAPTATSLTLAPGASCTFEVTAFDAKSEQLQASAGFTITSSDQPIARVLAPFAFDLQLGPPQPDPPVTGDEGSVQAVAKGSAAVLVQTGALSEQIAVTVQ